MKIVVSDSLIEAYLQSFGITMQEALGTAVRSDHSETIAQPAGGDLMLFAKRLAGPGHDFTVVVGGIPPDDDTVSIEFAVKLLPDLTAAGASAPTPAQLLRRLLDRYGFNVTVGARTDKLILGERIPVWSTDISEVFTSDAPADRPTLAQALIRLTGDVRQAYADCAACFVLDVEAYLRYLGPAALSTPELAAGTGGAPAAP